MKRATQATETPQVGRSVPRLESWLKVTGRGEYVHNMRLPGMLYGKIFRSTLAHGRITRIDMSAARAFAGVHRVLTIDDVRKVVPNPYYGPAFHDQPILAAGKVHYVGEPVAVVLATDPHVAEAAAQAIVAEYDELPAVFDEVEAMTSAAIVHDVLKPAHMFPDLKHLQGKTNTNIALDFHLRRGDPARAFAEAGHIFEHTFRTQQVLHLPLEPFVSVADAADAGLTIHTASQSPSFVRIEIARVLGCPENKVLVWAYESHTDMMARALKLDPIEFRRKNILREGRPQATGTAMADAAIEAVLDRLAARMNWGKDFDRGTGPVKRGRGVAIGFKAV